LIDHLDVDLQQIERQDFKKYPKFDDIDFNQFHYRFRLDIWGYPRIVEPLVLLSLHFKINYLKSPSRLGRIKNFLFDQLCLLIFFISKLTYLSPREAKLLSKKIRKYLKKFPLLRKIKKILTN
tara:strand:+ start:183 stop:551 length:369 start_codon:yes stop_codon:yes gene_type:complete